MTTYLCVVIIHLYQTYGTPSLQSQYWRRVASDNLAQEVLLLGRPSYHQPPTRTFARPSSVPAPRAPASG